MLRFASVALIAGGLLASGCINPLAARRAQTLKPGEVEVLIIPEIAGIGGAIGGPLGGAVTDVVPAYPSVTASMRFGIVDKLDLQLIVDPSIIPEVSIGYQLVGEQPGDFALTLTAGIKPAVFSAGGATVGLVHVPIGVLVDIPLGEDSALYTGVTVPPQIGFGGGGGTGGAAFSVEPTVHAGLSLKVGSLIVQPEISVGQSFLLFDTSGNVSPTPALLQYAVGVGLGGRFGGPAPAPPASGDGG